VLNRRKPVDLQKMKQPVVGLLTFVFCVFCLVVVVVVDAFFNIFVACALLWRGFESYWIWSFGFLCLILFQLITLFFFIKLILKSFKQGQNKYGNRESMNRLKLAGFIILAIGVGIWLYLLVLSVIDPRTQYRSVNIQYAIVAMVLVLVSYLIKRYSKKSETKQTLLRKPVNEIISQET
jgi:uncharacterized membrane protein